MNQNETCAAISTAHGKAGIAVIRLSGENAVEIAAKVFILPSGKPLTEVAARHAVFGAMLGADGIKIDTGIATVFRAPHSYTGEDTVELCCHGSMVGASMILASLFSAGARQALPGEFTRRAFINGRLDLTQAEAVGSLLDAESADELKISVSQLDGTLGKYIRRASDRIASLLAAVYAYIDYPDEDMSDMTDDELSDGIRDLLADLSRLEGSYASGLAVTKGLHAAIIGRPNTGKSTFFNMLLARDRAIVTDIPGTTRDVITETVSVGGIKLHIADTAGIRETSDTVERIGVEKSAEALRDASLIFAVFDASKPLDDEDKNVMDTLDACRDKNVIVVLNKRDAAAEADISRLADDFTARGFSHILSLSAKNETGKSELEALLHTLYPTDSGTDGGMILINARQYAAVNKAVTALRNAENAMKTLTRDMAGLDLEEALAALEEADGRSISEEIVSRIFSKFCVGK